MTEREKLEQAIADVEAQRAALGDKSADTILLPSKPCEGSEPPQGYQARKECSNDNRSEE
jgi:hypothetical protein